MKAASPAEMNRSFGLVMAGGLCALAIVRFLVTGLASWWILGLGGGFLIAAMLYPGMLDPLRIFWMKLAMILGFINQRILLTIIFALLITPMAVILRLMGKRPIALGLDASASSYWRSRRSEDCSAARMERQF